jgi:hypothetical protein
MKYPFENYAPQVTFKSSVANFDYVPVDLPYYIAEIRKEYGTSHTSKNAITIYKDLLYRMALIKLTTNGFYNHYKSNGNISIEVLQGEIIFDTAVQTIELKIGEILFLQESIFHKIKALEQTTFHLTVGCTNNF